MKSQFSIDQLAQLKAIAAAKRANESALSSKSSEYGVDSAWSKCVHKSDALRAWPLVSTFRAECILHLDQPARLKPAFARVVQAIFDHDEDSEQPGVASDAVGLLFELSCTGSGTLVGTAGSPSADVGVLILGYAGSSVELLSPLVEVYRRLWASSSTTGVRVVATVASGLCDYEQAVDALDAQCDATVSALAGCESILVHAMSNNGQGLWATLLHRRGAALRDRVAAVIYDCSCHDGQLQHHKWEETIMATVLGPILIDQVEATDRRGVRVECFDDAMQTTLLGAARRLSHGIQAAEGGAAAATATAAATPASQTTTHLFGCATPTFWGSRLRLDGLGMSDYVAAHEPSVPTLCLTSAGDALIPPAAVQSWARDLTAQCPGRSVQVATLKGPHCQLLQRDGVAFRARIQQFVLETRLMS